MRKLPRRKGIPITDRSNEVIKPKAIIIKKVINTLKEETEKDMNRISKLKEVGIHVIKTTYPSFMYISSSTADSFSLIAQNQQRKAKITIYEDNNSVSSDTDSENEIEIDALIRQQNKSGEKTCKNRNVKLPSLLPPEKEQPLV